MAVSQWTEERLKACSASELETLFSNASRLKAGELAARCRDEIQSRGQMLGQTRDRRGSSVSAIERKIARELGVFAQELNKQFDLSASGARRRSIGTSGFMPHNTTCSMK